MQKKLSIILFLLILVLGLYVGCVPGVTPGPGDPDPDPITLDRVKPECSKAKYGKAIQRSEYTELINKNKDRIENNRNYYRRR